MKAKRKFRLSLLARLVLCFALGGVLINGTIWYKLTFGSRPASGFFESASESPPEGPPDFAGGPDQGRFPPDGPPPDFPGPRNGERFSGGPKNGGMPPHYRPMMINDAQDVVAALEREPTVERARILARRTGIEIRLESPSGGWTTDSAVPPGSELHGEFMPGGIRVDSRHVLIRRADSRWIFLFPRDWKPSILSDVRFRWLVLGHFSFVIFFCLVFGYWQLGPLRSLERGAREIARGKFDHQVPVEQESELGDLARAFNLMSAEVKTLMEAKDELLAGISHELRSPLTRMKLAIQVEGAEALPRIERNIAQMERLTSELLESSRWDNRKVALRVEPLSVAHLFAELKENYAGRSPGIQIEDPAGDPPLWADRERLSRILVNLVENALKYAGASREPVTLVARGVAGGVEIAVRDRGPGVPEEELGRIFEAYYRADPSRRDAGGYGLGLSLCKKIAEAHGGTLSARNLPRGGLEVTLFLPELRMVRAA